jgi:HEXXH motif-containing protein
MNLPLHRLSREAFTALASGGGGADVVLELAAAEYSKHMLLLRGVLDAAAGTPQYPQVRDGYELLGAAWRANQTAAESVIRHPSVGAWARQTVLAHRSSQVLADADPRRLCAVGAAAAIRAGLTAQIELPVAGGLVVLPSLGAAQAVGSAALARIDGGTAAVGSVELPGDPHRDATGWFGMRQLQTGLLDVLVDDLDPSRMPTAPGLTDRAGTESFDIALCRVSDTLEQDHPVAAAEIAAAVSVIVPRSRPRVGAVSTTAPDAYGAIAMSVPPDPIAGAETFVHETQHLKLGALLDIVALIMPDDRYYYAPWRDDPRPLGGLLQGTYAFLGVAGFWRRQREIDGGPQADVLYARQQAGVALAIDILRSSGRLTDAGQDFVAGMASTLDAWHADRIPRQAAIEARRTAESHLARWESVNGPVRRLD